MKRLPQHALLVCLLVPCFRVYAQTSNPYDLKLQQLSSRWPSASTLEKLCLLSQTFDLREYVNDPTEIDRRLETLSVRKDEPELVQAEAVAFINDLRSEQPFPGEVRHWYEDEQKRRRVLADARKTATDAKAEGLQLLAELEHMAGSAEASEHMEQAARLAPSARRWQRAAFFTNDPFRKFAALEAGQALDAADPNLNLQLATYYIGRQQLEKARDLLTRASGSSPGDFVVREHLAGLYLNLGLRSAALRELETLQLQFPATLWLRSRLALDYEQIGLREEAARLAASVMAGNKQSRELLELLARFHESRHMGAALESDYRGLAALEPASQELWRKLAQVQTSLQDLHGARTSLLRLLALNNQDAQAHRLLADIYRKLQMDAEAQRELAAAERMSTAGNVARKATLDERFLVSAEAVAKNAFLHPPEAADVALADVRVQELYSNGLDRSHVQQIFYVGSEAGLEAHRVTSIRYSPQAEALHIVHARVWKPSGQAWDAQNLGERPFSDAMVSMYYDMRTRQLRFPGLEKGDVVELEYSLTPAQSANPYGAYFGDLVFFAGHIPVALKRYALIAPATQTIFTHAEKVRPPALITEGETRIMVWESSQMAGLPREARSPGMTELAPYVHVSTFADWQQLGAWYADLVRPQFALDQALQEALAHLIKGKRNDKEKIAAIQEFVLRSTHYVALEFGIYSYKPYAVSQTYARRYGDCKDKASLMIALLRAAGIEAELALVRTRSLGDVAIQPASMALFDHAIVYVPKYDLWLDGTAEYAVRELPLEDQGALALTVDLGGAAQLRHIPMSRASDNYTRRTIRAELTREGAIHFSGSAVARGEDAPGLRHELAEREQQLDHFRRSLAEVFPTVQVYSVDVHDVPDVASESSDNISVTFQGALDGLPGKRTLSLGSSWMPRGYVSALAPSTTRSLDLLLPSPWITEEEIHIALPAGTEIRELPRDKNVNTDFGVLKLRYRTSSTEIVIESQVQFERTRITAHEYPAFRQFCTQAEQIFRNEIKLGLPQ